MSPPNPANDVVLVADDDASIREALYDVLTSAGYHVIVVENGAEVLDYMHGGRRPAVIVLDLMMPVMDGWTALKRMQQDPEVADVPVVVLTAGGRRAIGSAPGARAYLTKPVNIDALLRELESARGPKKVAGAQSS